MASIDWLNGISGAWTAAADWAGGAVPGASDTAVIDASPSAGSYTVTLDTGVAVAGLVLDQAAATLAVGGSLSATAIDLQAGTLALDKGTLTGTVTQGGGHLDLFGSGNTLENVTWLGDFAPGFFSRNKLTIQNGLTLLNAAGDGPGTATFYGAVQLNGVTELNNATITDYAGDDPGEIIVAGSPTLTLGAQLTVNDADFNISGNDTLVNDGSLVFTDPFVSNITGSARSVFVNNGLITVDNDFIGQITGSLSPGLLQNNGTILVTKHALLEFAPQSLDPAGAIGVIDLQGGDLILPGTMTTSALLALYATQHVEGSKGYGFGVAGLLDNTGTTLSIGPGTALGELDATGASYADAQSGVTGGTIVDGGNTLYDGYGGTSFTLSSLNLQFLPDAVTIGGLALNDVDITGPGTLHVAGGAVMTGGTISGFSTIVLDRKSSLQLDQVALANTATPLTLDLLAADLQLNLGDQSGALAIDVVGNATLDAGSEGALANTAITADRGGGTQTVNFDAGQTLAASSSVVLGRRAILSVNFDGIFANAGHILDGGQFVTDTNGDTSTLENSGDITVSSGGTLSVGKLVNSGTVAVTGGLLALAPASLMNTGSISVTDGTLLLLGATLRELSAIPLSASSEIVADVLDLGGRTVTPGMNGVPLFTLASGGGEYFNQVNDGTLAIGAGTGFGVPTYTFFGASLSNDGTVTVGGDHNGFDGPITGNGTIIIKSPYGEPGFGLGSSVAEGQTIAFSGHGAFVSFDNPAAAAGFAGMLADFAPGDSLGFIGDTVTAAQFSGATIDATLSTGQTLALATASALSGSLSVSNAAGTAVLTYAHSGEVSAPDWFSWAHGG